MLDNLLSGEIATSIDTPTGTVSYEFGITYTQSVPSWANFRFFGKSDYQSINTDHAHTNIFAEMLNLGAYLNNLNFNYTVQNSSNTGTDPLYEDKNIILGTSADEVITGTNSDDAIEGLAGNDIIRGDSSAIDTIMEAGRLSVSQNNSTEWHTVTFTETLNAPAIKLFAEDVDVDPFTLRVRNVTDTGFEFQIDEYDYQDGIHGLENISWLAVSSGRYTLSNGLTIEAGYTTAADETTTNVTFDGSLTNPVVFSQVSSYNESDAVVSRHTNVSDTGFTINMHEQESNVIAHATEDIGWIAIESGGSVASGILTGSTGSVVTHLNSTINFGSSFSTTPVFIADMLRTVGVDPATTAGATLSSSQASVFIDEEQSSDVEVNHAAEDVGYIALNAGTYTASVNVSASDVIKGGDGDDILYADAVTGINIANGASSNPLTAEILNDAPAAYWNFNETSGPTAINQGTLGASVNGTFIGSVDADQAKLYAGGIRSFSFNGINEGIYIPDNDGINTAAGGYTERTVELVFNANDIMSRQVLYEEGGSANGFTIYIDAGNLHVTGAHQSNWGPVNINAAISVGETYHAAFVFDQPSNSFTGYLNGADIGSTTVNNAVFSTHSGDIGIGYAPDSLQFHDGAEALGGWYFNGSISDIAIYNDALTAADMSARAAAITLTSPTPIAIDDVISGGDGFDQMHGGDGRDVFVFEAISAFNDIDEIYAFNVAEQDALDISDLLTNYTDGDDVNNFVQARTVGNDTIISIDSNGAVGGANYLDIATLIDVTGINIDSLNFNNSLIMD